jgi:hypothetical protein
MYAPFTGAATPRPTQGSGERSAVADNTSEHFQQLLKEQGITIT